MFVGPRAERDLKKLPAQTRSRVLVTLRSLAVQPHPPGGVKLRGREGWRVRVGDYRVIYLIDDEALVVTVIGVGHRRDVYRQG